MNAHARHLLLALHRATNGDPLDSAPLVVVSGYARIPYPGQALQPAILLEAAGLIRMDRSTTLEENRLQITVAGVAEAVRLSQPFWKRWVGDRNLVQNV